MYSFIFERIMSFCLAFFSSSGGTVQLRVAGALQAEHTFKDEHEQFHCVIALISFVIDVVVIGWLTRLHVLLICLVIVACVVKLHCLYSIGFDSLRFEQKMSYLFYDANGSVEKIGITHGSRGALRAPDILAT